MVQAGRLDRDGAPVAFPAIDRSDSGLTCLFACHNAGLGDCGDGRIAAAPADAAFGAVQLQAEILPSNQSGFRDAHLRQCNAYFLLGAPASVDFFACGIQSVCPDTDIVDLPGFQIPQLEGRLCGDGGPGVFHIGFQGIGNLIAICPGNLACFCLQAFIPRGQLFGRCTPYRKFFPMGIVSSGGGTLRRGRDLTSAFFGSIPTRKQISFPLGCRKGSNV